MKTTDFAIFDPTLRVSGANSPRPLAAVSSERIGSPSFQIANARTIFCRAAPFEPSSHLLQTLEESIRASERGAHRDEKKNDRFYG